MVPGCVIYLGNHNIKIISQMDNVNRIFQIGGNQAHSAVSGSGDGCREAPLD